MKMKPDTLMTQSTICVAKGLIGCRLITRVGGKETSGMIVEVEAYHEKNDEASHSFGRRTAANEVMFTGPGTCYVYFIYGMHYCVNVVTENEGTGAAVLIRAVEPLTGINIMNRRRNTEDLKRLANGPGKLCQALGIDRSALGEDLLSSSLISLEPFRTISPEEIGRSTRIGISRSRHLQWRFFLKGSPFLSRRD